MTDRLPPLAPSREPHGACTRRLKGDPLSSPVSAAQSCEAGQVSMRRAALLTALVLVSACAPKGVQSPVEKAPPAEVERARALAAEGDADAARRAYESFLAAHPGTVEADLARLELGILEAANVGCEQAMTHLWQAKDSPDSALSLRAALHVADCQLEQKKPEEALQTLAPLSRERFAENEQRLLWDTAVEASEETLDAQTGLLVMDGLIEAGGSPPDPERTSAAVELLVIKLSLEQAAALFDSLVPQQEPKSAVARRLLEQGLAAQDAELIGRSAEALRSDPTADEPEVRALIARADEFLHGNPFVVGALLPLSGRGREVGRQLLQGMQLAALHEGGPEILVEDTEGNPTVATQAADRLVEDGRVVALLGPVGNRTTEAAAQATHRSGVPLLTFSASDTATAIGDQVFRALYSPREEVRALVRRARERGHSRFVILYPDHGYGRTMQRLFTEEVAAVGASTCPGVAYPPGTRSFVEAVKLLLEQGCDTILLADTGAQVASIAPTFAAEGAWSLAEGRLPEGADREVHFLLPSPSWSPTLVPRAGRYLQGALIVVPFYDGSEAPTNLQFRESYQERYGRPPGTFAAYGYDAYRWVALTLRQGYQTRESLAAALTSETVLTPVTSTESFSAERTPATAARVYEVVGAALLEQE
ncbi:MAG: penicillin-binding protein activator [Myxococcota bacterium]